ncbi:hypothetical protein Salat_0001200 [Sesamum alatum]|uniref:Uncharacterized protein n=1 Tax=Sesamum alatum TaxID=300844 RepID=A0AAE1YV60_9LAMI|nr:hypothetical protein Salat_0001200 [Sesamum alatum]
MVSDAQHLSARSLVLNPSSLSRLTAHPQDVAGARRKRDVCGTLTEMISSCALLLGGENRGGAAGRGSTINPPRCHLSELHATWERKLLFFLLCCSINQLLSHFFASVEPENASKLESVGENSLQKARHG